MLQMTTIRSELEDYIYREGTTIRQFAKTSGINAGTISKIITGNRPIAMDQLDRITEGMGLVEGSLYDVYVDDCAYNFPLSWRRMRPFLYRCAELNKLDCIQKAVSIMMDNLSYVQMLFDTAEDFFKAEKYAVAAIIYENVAESEKYQHSERLALCKYRLFSINLGQNQDDNLRAAVHFESYVDRLDEADQLDAIKDLANMYISLRRWDRVDELAEEMGCKAYIQYEYKYKKIKRDKPRKEPKLPLFWYILYGYLLRSAVCDARGDYVQALSYVPLYSDMSWVRENTEEASRIKQQYKAWAEVNMYLYKLMMGEVNVLPKYVAYIEQHESEILHALFKIIEAANRFQINVDDILLRFKRQIADYSDSHGKVGTYTQQVIADRFTHFLAELAIYYLDRKMYNDGIECILSSLATAVDIHSDTGIIRCVGLFEEFRHVAPAEAQIEYQNIIRKVRKFNEKKIGFAVVDN